MMKIIIFLLLFTSQRLLASEYPPNSQVNFHPFASEDRAEIKELFKNWFKFNVFAYSLFGDKPMSFSEPLKEPSPSELLEFLSLKVYCLDTLENVVELPHVFKKRWVAWSKYISSLN